MQTERTFVDELKYQYSHGGMHIRLIIFNTAVFIVIGIAFMIQQLMGVKGGIVGTIFQDIFTLQPSFSGVITKPWGLFTSIFAHFGFIHFLINMLFLYFAGSMFIQFFTHRRLLHVYLVAGIMGGLFEIIAHELFPVFQESALVVGASGSVMGIFMALAFYRPNLQVNLFGVFPVRLILIAGLYLLYDLISLGSKDNTAHFAHIGGALVGILSVTNLHSSTNIINLSERLGQQLSRFFSNLFKPKSKLRVQKGGGRAAAVKTDEQYNIEAKARQKKIDQILDKISKSGYESLSKAEKEFLFSQSKKNE